MTGYSLSNFNLLESHIKKDKKKIWITVCIKVYNKCILFWQGSNGVCIPIRGNFFLKANKRYQTYQLNTCLKLAIEALEQGIKYVQS